MIWMKKFVFLNSSRNRSIVLWCLISHVTSSLSQSVTWNSLLNPTSLPAFLFCDLWLWISSVSGFLSVCFDQAVYSMGTKCLLWERKGYLYFPLGHYLTLLGSVYCVCLSLPWCSAVLTILAVVPLPVHWVSLVLRTQTSVRVSRALSQGLTDGMKQEGHRKWTSKGLSVSGVPWILWSTAWIDICEKPLLTEERS